MLKTRENILHFTFTHPQKHNICKFCAIESYRLLKHRITVPCAFTLCADCEGLLAMDVGEWLWVHCEHCVYPEPATPSWSHQLLCFKVKCLDDVWNAEVRAKSHGKEWHCRVLCLPVPDSHWHVWGPGPSLPVAPPLAVCGVCGTADTAGHHRPAVPGPHTEAALLPAGDCTVSGWICHSYREFGSCTYCMLLLCWTWGK